MSNAYLTQLPEFGVNETTREITDSWEQIQQATFLGVYKSRYQIGDIKILTLDDGTTLEMQIVAFDTDEKADKTGKAAITWISKNIPFKKQIDSSNTNKTWAESELRAWLQKDFFSSLPKIIRKAIVPVNKTFFAFKDLYTEGETKTSVDSIWIPSEREISGINSIYESQGVEYSSFFTLENRIKKNNNITTTWHLRTNCRNKAFSYIGLDGNILGHQATISRGVAIGFCTDIVNSSIKLAPLALGIRTAQVLRGLMGKIKMGNGPVLAPSDTWYQSNTLKSTITEITFKDSYSPTSNVLDSWAADENRDGSIMCYIEGTNLTIAGNNSGKILANADSAYLFGKHEGNTDYFSSLTTIEGFSLLDTSKIVNASKMFSNCLKLSNIDFSKKDFREVKNMSYMFYNCKALTSLELDSFYTNSAENMSNMFLNCNNLQNLKINNFNTKKVTNMSGMFYNCSSLTALNLSHFDTSSVIDISNMFRGCQSLKSLNVGNFDTRQVKKMNYCFYDCSSLLSLDLSNFDTSNLEELSYTFYNCKSLPFLNLKNFNTSKVTTMKQLFQSCEKMCALNIDNFDTSLVQDMNSMFGYCALLPKLNLSGFNTTMVTDMTYMFQGCKKLEHIYIGNEWNDSNADTTGRFNNCLAQDLVLVSEEKDE